jgi:hypothetical protein
MAYQPKIYRKQGGDVLFLADGAVVKTESDIGTAGTGVTAVEYWDSCIHKTVLTLTPAAIAVADGASNGHAHIYTFPRGLIQIVGGVIDGSILCTANFNASTADLFYASVGTADGSGALSTSEVNLVASTTFDTESGGMLTHAWHGVAGVSTAAIDASTTGGSALVAKINIYVPTANDSGDNTFTVTGTLKMYWYNLGDY